MQYEGTVYRPPSEARSLIVQVTVGCAHNTCTFCTMYKDKKFKIRPLADILADFDEAAMLYGGHIRRIFLADGDALIVKTEMLIQILTYIWEKFPNLERVTAYGTTQDILHKSEEELMQLKAAGLDMVYMGIESGDPQVLKDVKKGVTRGRDDRSRQEAEKMRYSLFGHIDFRPWRTAAAERTRHCIGFPDQRDQAGLCWIPDIDDRSTGTGLFEDCFRGAGTSQSGGCGGRDEIVSSECGFRGYGFQVQSCIELCYPERNIE